MKLNYNNSSLVISAVNEKQFLDDKPQIVFCGRSNVGKSSAINALLSRKSLARTSSKPGKTATINYYNIDNQVYFVDLPGYGYASVSQSEKEKWAKFIEKYFDKQKNILLAISIVDLRHDPSKLDINMIEYLSYKNIPFIVVATKCDKLKKSQIEKNLNALKEKYNCEVIMFSSLKKIGVDEINKIIIDRLEF